MTSTDKAGVVVTAGRVMRLLWDAAQLGAGTLFDAAGAMLNDDVDALPANNAKAIATAIEDGRVETVVKVSQDLTDMKQQDFLVDCLQEMVNQGNAALAGLMSWKAITMGHKAMIQDLSTRLIMRVGAEDYVAQVTAAIAEVSAADHGMEMAAAAMAPAIIAAVEGGALLHMVDATELIVNKYHHQDMISKVASILMDLGRGDIAGKLTRKAMVDSPETGLAGGKIAGQMLKEGKVGDAVKAVFS